MASKKDQESKPLVVYPARTALPAGAPLCLDLFAGAGGLAVGFRNAGWAIVGANDLDRDAGATFRENFPESVFFQGPIGALTAEEVLEKCGLEVEQLDCLIGGPPCQSFSYNNHQRSENDERAKLFEHYLRIVRGLMPKMLVMENVPGILTIGGGSVIETIQAQLLLIGYQSKVEILSAEEYGTPQTRRRVFIVASRIGHPQQMVPPPTHRSTDLRRKAKAAMVPGLKRAVTIDKAIGDLPALANGGGEQKIPRPAAARLSAFQRKVRRGTRTLYNHVCHGLTEVNLRRIEHVPEGGNWRDIPRELLPAGMQRAKLSDHTKRYGRLANSGLASTILTKCDPHWGAYVHPSADRTISVREAARLQGFPDTFRFAGDRLSKQYEQVGNAVPVPVAEAVGDSARAHLQNPQPLEVPAQPADGADAPAVPLAA